VVEEEEEEEEEGGRPRRRRMRRGLRRPHVTIQNVVIRVADAAGLDFDEDLARLGLGDGDVLDFKRLLHAGEDGSFHGLGDGLRRHVGCNCSALR